MAITLEEVMARERIKMEHDEVILSKLKAKEYKLHPDTTYLLTFESVLKPEEMSALRNIFSGSARNIYVIHGSEVPNIYTLVESGPVKFPEKRTFLEEPSEWPTKKTG